ncbi:MAG: hypothetical protein ACHQHO_08020 [Solirubrobacterales bacterium]
MTDAIDEIPEQVLVCPGCGTPAEPGDYCAYCGLHLAALRELPSRAQWLAGGASGGRPAHSSAHLPPLDEAPAPSLPVSSGPVVGSARPAASAVRSGASIGSLLHPTEPSRLALALIAAGLALLFPFLILIRTGGLGGILVALAVIVGTIWVAVQLSRARLLGHSVRVDASTFPEVQAIVAEVCATLDYRRPIEVYITEKATPSIVTTSLLGTRLIVIEGGLVADLLPAAKRPQLTFLIGRSIGALRARHMRLEVVIRILEAAEVLKYVAPFIRPYYRATAYSGDQIGMMCCSDLEAALEATRRLLVGGGMAAELTAGAAVPQALLVKQRVLPRLVQFLAAEPHVTNRYANLLCFGRYHAPELWAGIFDSMDEHERRCVEEIWRRSPYCWRAA